MDQTNHADNKQPNSSAVTNSMRMPSIEGLYYDLARHLPDIGLVVYDENLQVIGVEGVEKIRPAIEAADFIGLNVADLFADGYRPSEAWLRATFEGKTAEFEAPVQDTCFLITRVPIASEESSPLGMIVVQDITGRKDAEVRLARSAGQLSAINQLGQYIISTVDQDVIFKEVVERLRVLLDAEAVTISLKQDNKLTIVAASSETLLGLEGSSKAADSGISGRVLQTSTSVFHTGEEVRRYIDAEAESTVSYHTQTMMAAPLMVQGKAVGVLGAAQSKVEAFERADLNLLEAAARWTSIAINNAIMFKNQELSKERLRRLTKQIVATQEEERRRVARELHDEAGQSLTALRISLGLIAGDLPAGMKEIHERIQSASKLAEETMERIRRLTYNLRPPELDAMGLVMSLEELCEDFARRTRLEIDYNADDIPSLPDVACITLYRFLQEALTNVAKHAQASSVEVALAYDESEEEVNITVRDNGHGLKVDPADLFTNSAGGLGLLGMRERFDGLDGKLNVISVNGEGVKLVATIPYQSND